jgi:hypothetical protein
MNAYTANDFSNSVLNVMPRAGSSKSKYHNLLNVQNNNTSFLPKINEKNHIGPSNLYST